MVIIAVVSGIATILGFGWTIYAHYHQPQPKPQLQPEPPSPQQQTGPRLSQSLPAEQVNPAVIFLDWIQKNHNGYVQSYPSYFAIRPYLTILQQDGFIEQSSVSNTNGTVYELTAQGQKALLAAGVKLF